MLIETFPFNSSEGASFHKEHGNLPVNFAFFSEHTLELGSLWCWACVKYE